MALLTPKDIREHAFQTVRFKEGYDVEEVDDFLDQVTETVEALGKQAVANDNGQSTQSLGPDVSKLNSKISDLTSQVQSLSRENQALKAASKNTDADRASMVAASKLTEAEESNKSLTQQNKQLKDQVDRLNSQIDQLTAQAAQAAGKKDLNNQLVAVQHERDEFRSGNEKLSRELEQAKKQLASASSQAQQIQDLSRQLQESKQRENQLRAQVSKIEPNTETGSLQKIAGAAAGATSEPERATAMLTLAMQLHDQYVDKGKAKAKEITEASQVKYQEMLTKANDYSTRTRGEADEYAKQTRGKAEEYSKHTRTEADGYAQKTRTAADDYSTQKRATADAYEAEVQRRAGEYDQKTRSAAEVYAKHVRENLAEESKAAEANIQSLKQFETEYRSRLTDFLKQLVSQVGESDSYNAVEESKD
jgi:DivIVA domain-containing protein